MYPIVKKEKLADKIYLMDVKAPRVAQYCEPGQFVIVKIDEQGERIPLTICDYNREAGIRSRSYFRRWELPHSAWYPWSRGMRSQISWDRLDVLLI